MPAVGWDIGGVNTKVAHVGGGRVLSVLGRPYEIQRDPRALVPLLREMLATSAPSMVMPHALTMTAELSQIFRTKREGVRFVLHAVESAFPSASIHVYTVDGHFLTPADARERPLSVAAANWAATAHAVADHHPNALLVDIGTTTTDLVPIVDGKVVAVGKTDPARLMSGELVYTGALRTPAEAIASYVPLGDALAGVSAEGFALAGDVHVWRGDLAPADYSLSNSRWSPDHTRVRGRASGARRLRRSRNARRGRDHATGRCARAGTDSLHSGGDSARAGASPLDSRGGGHRPRHFSRDGSAACVESRGGAAVAATGRGRCAVRTRRRRGVVARTSRRCVLRRVRLPSSLSAVEACRVGFQISPHAWHRQ